MFLLSILFLQYVQNFREYLKNQFQSQGLKVYQKQSPHDFLMFKNLTLGDKQVFMGLHQGSIVNINKLPQNTNTLCNYFVLTHIFFWEFTYNI